MVYVVGIAGLVAGFLFGQLILSHILRGRGRDEILAMMKDPAAKWKYGLLNWGVAALGMASFVWAYKRYFF